LEGTPVRLSEMIVFQFMDVSVLVTVKAQS